MQARIAAGYRAENASFERVNLLGSASTVKANGKFETYGFTARLGWGVNLTDSLIATPYIGLLASNASRLGYSESVELGLVEQAFTYNKYRARQLSGLVGLNLTGTLTDKVLYRLGVGMEHDLSYKINDFTVSGNFGSSSYSSLVEPRSFRANGSAGLTYMITPQQAFSVDGYVSRSNYGNPTDYTLMAGFKFGF